MRYFRITKNDDDDDDGEWKWIAQVMMLGPHHHHGREGFHLPGLQSEDADADADAADEEHRHLTGLFTLPAYRGKGVAPRG